MFGAVAYGAGPYGGPEGLLSALTAGDFPTLALEVAFYSDPGDESPTWTDISSRLRSGSVNRGRQRELDQYQAGRATFVLDNRDRALDPLYGANIFSSLSGAPDATFEGGIGGWVAQNNATVAHTTAQAKSGVGALQVTATSGSIDASAHSPTVPVSAGQELTGIISGRAVATSRDVDLRFLWYDVDGNQLNDSTFDTFTDVTGSWTTGTVTATAPAGAAEAALSLSVIGPAASEEHRFDEAGILRSGTTWETPAFYAGRVVPMKRIRLRSTYAGVTHPVFDGFVDSWDQNYRQPREAHVEVTATDAFKVFAAARLASAVYTQEVRTAAPKWWFRLGEAAGSTLVGDSIDAIPGVVSGTVTLGQDGLVGDADTAATFASTGGVVITDPRAFLTGSVTAFTFEAVIRTSAVATQVILQQDGSDSAQFRLRMLGTGILEFQVSDAGLAYSAETEGIGTVNNGATHHVAATFSTTNGLQVWVDGVNVSNVVATDTGTPTVVAQSFTLGNDKSLVVNGWTGVLDEVAVYDRELSSMEIADHASAVLTPWVGDGSGERVDNVLDGIDWPAALRDVEAGQSTLQAATLGVSVLDHLQKVAQSEFGELYITADGLVRFEERNSLVNQPNFATFGDGSGELAYADIGFDFSDQLIRNDVTVGRQDGAAQQVEDAVSIKANLRHSYVRDGLLHNDDALSRYAAIFLLAMYKDPFLRVTDLDLAPRRDPTNLFPQVLGRELTDRVTVVRRPQGVGDAISQECVIEGITHGFNASKKNWATSWSLSPAYTGCYIEFDDGAGSAPCGFDEFAFYL